VKKKRILLITILLLVFGSVFTTVWFKAPGPNNRPPALLFLGYTKSPENGLWMANFCLTNTAAHNISYRHYFYTNQTFEPAYFYLQRWPELIRRQIGPTGKLGVDYYIAWKVLKPFRGYKFQVPVYPASMPKQVGIQYTDGDFSDNSTFGKLRYWLRSKKGKSTRFDNIELLCPTELIAPGELRAK
jgi:hypothetical protein